MPFTWPHSRTPELCTFLNLLNSSSELCTIASNGGNAILARTNDALTAANITLSNSTVPITDLEPLVSYHILQTQQPSAAFSSATGIFFSTLHENTTFTNNTGGEVVEACNGTVPSAMWSKSNIITGDIFYTGGFIHSIDKVLSVPQCYAESVTAAHLDDYVALGTHTQLTTPEIWPKTIEVWYSPDTTVFAPNSPQYATNFTGRDDLTLAEDLKIWQYHIVNTSVLFTTNLTNGTTFTTSAGLPVTAWRDNAGDIYVNDAKTIEKDLLHANGVIRVLDRPLNPNNTDSMPQMRIIATDPDDTPSEPNTQTTASPTAHGTIDAASLTRETVIAISAGSGVGGIVVILALLWYCCIWRRRAVQEISHPDRASLVQNVSQQGRVAEMSTLDARVAGLSTRANAWEMSGCRNSRLVAELWICNRAAANGLVPRRPQELP